MLNKIICAIIGHDFDFSKREKFVDTLLKETGLIDFEKDVIVKEFYKCLRCGKLTKVIED
jgi:hypothetical protein